MRTPAKPRRGNHTGMVPYRCAAFESLHEHGFSMAWTYDPLASSANKGLRACRARRLREERAAILARLEAEERLYALTELGRTALVAAEMAADHVALTGGGSLGHA